MLAARCQASGTLRRPVELHVEWTGGTRARGGDERARGRVREGGEHTRLGHGRRFRVHSPDHPPRRRDEGRALDYAVEWERHLVAFLHAKDALPAVVLPLHSLPSTITLSFRPLRFLPLYPLVFVPSPHPIEVSAMPRLYALHAVEAPPRRTAGR